MWNRNLFMYEIFICENFIYAKVPIPHIILYMKFNVKFKVEWTTLFIVHRLLEQRETCIYRTSMFTLMKVLRSAKRHFFVILYRQLPDNMLMMMMILLLMILHLYCACYQVNMFTCALTLQIYITDYTIEIDINRPR